MVHSTVLLLIISTLTTCIRHKNHYNNNIKKKHTDRYLHFESHNLTHVKRGAVRCLYDRARNITQRDESLKEEDSHLMKTFIGNGYPRAFVRSAAAPRTPREPSDDDDNDTEKPPTAFLPYVAYATIIIILLLRF